MEACHILTQPLEHELFTITSYVTSNLHSKREEEEFPASSAKCLEPSQVCFYIINELVCYTLHASMKATTSTSSSSSSITVTAATTHDFDMSINDSVIHKKLAEL